MWPTNASLASLLTFTTLMLHQFFSLLYSSSSSFLSPTTLILTFILPFSRGFKMQPMSFNYLLKCEQVPERMRTLTNAHSLCVCGNYWLSKLSTFNLAEDHYLNAESQVHTLSTLSAANTRSHSLSIQPTS